LRKKKQRTNTKDHIEKRFTKNVDKRRISWRM